MNKSYIILISYYYYYYYQVCSDFTSGTFQRLISVTFCKAKKAQLVELYSSTVFPDLEA